MAGAFDPEAYTRDARKSWSEAAPHYSRISADFFPAITKAFVEFIGLRPGERVLDVACGPATASLEASRVIGATGRLMCVDLSPAMLKLAFERAAGSPCPMEFREMNAEALDFPDQMFDAVFCQLGLMLFARPEKALRELRRVAKAGTSVSCLVQGEAGKMVFTSLLMKTMVKHAPELKVPGAPVIYAFGGAGVLEQALAKAGLAEVSSQRLQGTFAFESPEAYWKTMTEGAGRTGAMLRSLEPAVRSAVEQDVLRQAAGYERNGRLDIPYEFVMAKGFRA